MSSSSEVTDGVGTMTGEDVEVEVSDDFLNALGGRTGEDSVLS